MKLRFPPHIVCILGSPHRRGNSAVLADHFCRTASAKGSPVQSFFLNKLQYRGCQGCLSCKNGLDHCIQKDELTMVLDAISEADILVLTTPVYLGDISGQMKLFIDRTFSFVTPKHKDAPPESRLEKGRKLVFIQTQSQADEARFADIYEKYRHIFSGIGFDGSYLIRACGVSLQGEVENRPDLLALAESMAKRVLDDVRQDKGSRQSENGPNQVNAETGYEKFFSRNVGIISSQDQARLSEVTVAVAGVGGVGGLTAERLARLGITNFHLADPDTFEASNINRQYACTVGTLGRNKALTVADALREINPRVKVKILKDRVSEDNAHTFVQGVDLVIHAMDLFNLKDAVALFRAARAADVFTIQSASVGFGASLLVYPPDGLSFENYIGLPQDEDAWDDYQIPTQRIVVRKPSYISRVVTRSVQEGKGRISPPSISVGSTLSASLLTVEAVRILTKKGASVTVPCALKVDLFDQEMFTRDFAEEASGTVRT